MDAPVNSSADNLGRQTDPRWAQLEGRSVALLADTQTEHGSWPASPTFAPYRFTWFRDGAFVADGASASGLHAAAGRFHDWCSQVLVRETAAIRSAVAAAEEGATLRDKEYLPARYRLDGRREHDDWWNFQVDGYGTWLWALRRHVARTGTAADQWATGVELAVRYLLATGLEPCRDWWEEHREHRHVATLAGVCAGLESAVALDVLPAGLGSQAVDTAGVARSLVTTDGVQAGRLTKWLGGTAVDASLLSVAGLYDVLPLDSSVVRGTIRAVESQLAGAGGSASGVHRYVDDTFYGGGQWPVLACLLATHHVRTGERTKAAQLLDWVVSTADDNLLLPEQTAPQLAPARLQEWEERWGPAAHPLLWSHGAFLSALEAWRSL